MTLVTNSGPKRIVFLQEQVSQLDEPVYARMHATDPRSCAVVYWNDYGFVRTQSDPETRIVPDFVEHGHSPYPRVWLDRRRMRFREIANAIVSFAPSLVVLADVPARLRWRLASALRGQGVRVALRSDKNHLSDTRSRGVRLAIERAFTQATFDMLAPTSPLTSEYYRWPPRRPAVLFPYTTNACKFRPDEQVQLEARNRVRAALNIPRDAFVFVSAAKFSERENPRQLADSFALVARRKPHTFWLALGDGPLLAPIRDAFAKAENDRVRFPGFVPFRVLQDYLFAGDAFLHFPVIGPWEVSPQDALVAGMALVATESVGSAEVFFKGSERRFLVPVGDVERSADRMEELVTLGPRAAETVGQARSRTADYTVAATASRLLDVAS